MVSGYRSARDAEEAESESVSRGGWAARDDGNDKLTFKKWLTSSKGSGSADR
jgi:hypothetical protein